jgi:hypothetical protein
MHRARPERAAMVRVRRPRLGALDVGPVPGGVDRLDHHVGVPGAVEEREDGPHWLDLGDWSPGGIDRRQASVRRLPHDARGSRGADGRVLELVGIDGGLAAVAIVPRSIEVIRRLVRAVELLRVRERQHLLVAEPLREPGGVGSGAVVVAVFRAVEGQVPRRVQHRGDKNQARGDGVHGREYADRWAPGRGDRSRVMPA